MNTENNNKKEIPMNIYQVTDHSTGEIYEIEAKSATIAGLAFRNENKGVTIRPLNNTEEVTNMKKPMYAIAFTGHRPQKIGGYDPTNPKRVAVKQAMEDALKRAVVKHGDTHEIVVISGGALGVDQDAARIAYAMNIPFVVAEPCKEYGSNWPAESRANYKTMLSYAKQVITVGNGTYEELGQKCLNDRNIWMVDHCDALVAVWDGSQSGTKHCVDYAYKVNKPVVIIDPNDLGGNGGQQTPPTPDNNNNGGDNSPPIPKEETMKTVPPAAALIKRELLSKEDQEWLINILENEVAPQLVKDVSAYAPGRMRTWLPYEAPLDSPNSTAKPFVPGLLHDELWQFIVDICHKHGMVAQTALVSKGGNIKPHRDTTFAAPWAMGINLGSCEWFISPTRESSFALDSAGKLSKGDAYHMSLSGGEVFSFNSKHVHAVSNAAPDRWAINVWAIADTNAARNAQVHERLAKMLEENPQVAEFVDYHQPGVTNKKEKPVKTDPIKQMVLDAIESSKEETIMNTEEDFCARCMKVDSQCTCYDPTDKKEEIMDSNIKEYILIGTRPNIKFDMHSKTFVNADHQEWRVITNDIDFFHGDYICNEKIKVVQVGRGVYHAAMLEKIFGNRKFMVEVSDIKAKTNGLNPGYFRQNWFKSEDVFGNKSWAYKKTPKPATFITGWADLNSETVIFCEDPTFTLQSAGLVIGNGTKAVKRFAELVRFARGTMINESTNKIKKLVLTKADLVEVFPYLDPEDVKATFDGSSIISPWLVKKIYKSNPLLTGRNLAKALNNVDKGRETNWTLRVVTNIDGKPCMIKGNAIVSTKQMHKRLWDLGLAPKGEYFDIVTFEWNVKEELGTNGSFESFTIEPHHGPNYVRTNDQILAQYYGIRGIMHPTELLTAWKKFLAEAVQNIREGKDISWMIDFNELHATTEEERRGAILSKQDDNASLLLRQIERIHDAGLTIGVSQTLMNMRANGVRLSNISKDHLNEGISLDYNEPFNDVHLPDVFSNWSAPSKEKKSNMVMPHAYRAYAMTKEIIWLAGHEIDLDDENCVYHEATQTFALPGEEWARIAPILGGADLDDEIMIMERLIVELDGSFGIKAFLLRSPNDWAEYAIVNIDGPSGQARIAYDDMPTLHMSDLLIFDQIPVCGDLPSVAGIVTKPSYARPMPPVYDASCAEYMWRAAKEMTLGVGGQVKVKMLQYATKGAFWTLPCPNDQMIDALQAPTGTIDDMIVLDAWEKDTFIKVVTNGVQMDAYWWESRKVGKTVAKLVEQDKLSYDQVTPPLSEKNSPIVCDLMIPRQMEVMAAYKEMLGILNRQIVEIIDIQDIFESKTEEDLYKKKAIAKKKEFSSAEHKEIVAVNTLKAILDYYNKDKEACYKFVLKMARASYLVKKDYIDREWDSRNCFDQWLYYGVQVDGVTTVDIFCEALEWYRSL